MGGRILLRCIYYSTPTLTSAVTAVVTSESLAYSIDLATYQSIIATSEGRVKANTVRQVPAESRWDWEEINEISIKPWEDHKPKGPRERDDHLPSQHYFAEEYYKHLTERS